MCGRSGTSPYSHNRACRTSNSEADRLTWKLRPAVSVTEKVKSGAGQPGPCFVNPAAVTTNGQQSQPADLELPQFSHTDEPIPASHSNIGPGLFLTQLDTAATKGQGKWPQKYCCGG